MLRPRDVVATVVSVLIGAGIFTVPAEMLGLGASPVKILIIFMVAGLMTILGALTFAELARVHPGNGGPYRYIREELGPAPAFLFTWTRFWMIQTGVLAILAIVFMELVGLVTGMDNRYWQAVGAIALVLGMALLNRREINFTARIQWVLTVLKIAALLGVVVAALLLAKPAGFAATPSVEAPAGLGILLLLAIFAYGGWAQATLMAGELAEPRKFASPLVLGIVVAMVLYAVSLGTTFLVMPDNTDHPILIAAAMEALLGQIGALAVVIAIGISILGTLQTLTMSGPRLYQAAAEKGQWMRGFGSTNKHGAPGHSIYYQALWASFLIAFSLLSFNAFLTLLGSTSLALWFFHSLTSIAWFKMRRRGAQSDYRTPGGAWTAFGFLGTATFVMVLAIWEDMQHVVAGNWANVQTLWAAGAIVTGLLALLVQRLVRTPVAHPIEAPEP